MAKRSRRQFTTEQKVAILKRHFVDKVPISTLCDEYKLQPSVLYHWQRQVFENMGAIFEGATGAGRPPSREKQLAARVEPLVAKRRNPCSNDYRLSVTQPTRRLVTLNQYKAIDLPPASRGAFDFRPSFPAGCGSDH